MTLPAPDDLTATMIRLIRDPRMDMATAREIITFLCNESDFNFRVGTAKKQRQEIPGILDLIDFIDDVHREGRAIAARFEGGATLKTTTDQLAALSDALRSRKII